MRQLHALLTFALLMLLAACANVDPSPNDSPPLVSEQHQALGEDFCELHPVACEAFERLCARHPVLCDELCDEHPNLPFCDDAPMCLEAGEPCDPEHPEECCDSACEADDEPTIGFYCQEAPPFCEGPVNGQICDPEGVPCCPDPAGGQYDCQKNDPNDPNGDYVCIPL